MDQRNREGRRWGLSVRWLLLGVNALVLLVPLLATLGIKLFQSFLVRQTEVKLIAESVLIGEAWRERLLEEEGVSPEGVDVRPSLLVDERYFPIEPILDTGHDVLPPVPDPVRVIQRREGPEWRAGERIKPLLDRAVVFNLTSARVLNQQGCVVASSGLWMGACLDDLPEVHEALGGRYAAVARRRISDEPSPPLSSIRRGGDIRVFTATPLFSAGEVIGVVWMSRTSLDPLKAAWLNRRPLLTILLGSALLTALVSLFLSRFITGPLKHITLAAQAVARGEGKTPLAPQGAAPTEIHALAKALSTMTSQLSDRAEYIAEFAANVTHELKSPITSIRGAAELMQEELGEMAEGQQRRFLGNIQADAARMERLVNRLLQLARIQSAPESAEEVEMAPFLELIAASYGDLVVVDCTSAPERIIINRDHIESALRNLLDNGVRHGAGQAVELGVIREGERVAFTVRDRGAGISEANQRRLFERFFTTERDRGGTGLGLAIVQAVAQTRGGEVTFETGAGGTTFTLWVC